VHSGLRAQERGELFEWFGSWAEPIRRTKVLVSTYDLTGKGLDGLKVANYCVHFGLCRDINMEKQASSRVDRQGQPLEVHVHYLHTKGGVADTITEIVRQKRGILLSTIEELFGGH
jgi:hypothetical protein